MTTSERDHGGGLDAAVACWGGRKDAWIDLSTGINPRPYPIPDLSPGAWTALPDRGAIRALEAAARRFWSVPNAAAVLAAPGASSLIARIPSLLPPGQVDIPGPTYNEHEAAFRAAGWAVGETRSARVLVHPNNPDGRFWSEADIGQTLTIVDESFCDVAPDQSLVGSSVRPGVVILKSFGKFWGLAGLRLGFAIGDPDLVAALGDRLGPWPVSGPALSIGAAALDDIDWAESARRRLDTDAKRLDALMAARGARCRGGTSLFRLYDTGDARGWQVRFARARIWTRIFPYSATWLRLGLPAPSQWDRLEAVS